MTTASKPVLLLQGSTKFGGSKQSLLGLARALIANGYQPVIACAQRGWLTEQLDKAALPYVLLPFFAWRKWLERFRVQPSIRRVWLPALAPWRFQLVHSNEFWWAPHAIMLGAQLQIPSVVHLRDGHHTLKKARQYRLEQANAVIAVSSALREQFVGDAGLHRRTHVLFNGHDETAVTFSGHPRDARASFRIDAEALVIGNAGTICDRKNQSLLVRAMAELKRSARLPAFKIVLAGDGEPAYLSALRREIEDLGLRNEVIFLGAVSDMGGFYAAVDILVHCARREGLPRVIPEAMLAKRPVIAAQAEGILDAIPDGRFGIVTPPDDAAALAREIEGLSANTARRQQIAAQAYEHAQRLFSLAANRDNIRELYERVCGGSEAF